MKVSFEEMFNLLEKVLLEKGFHPDRARLCGRIFSENSRDGVYSHGLTRFPSFIQMVDAGLINKNAEPERIGSQGSWENWDGQLGPGMYVAYRAMERAIVLARDHGLGAVSVKNTNHWMRGGTYGRLAAEAGCVGICSSNTIANLPPWGGIDPRLGNNPLVIAIPHREEPLVLDMAMSQFSYGKMQEYELKGEPLPYPGGYNGEGRLSMDPAEIRASKRALPIGLWKGAALSLMLDLLVSSLSGGKSSPSITAQGKEYGLSQFFLCIHPEKMDSRIADEIIEYARGSRLDENTRAIFYPGEKMYAERKKNLAEGIPVHREIWNQVMAM
jgi:3-dehydro-L-gulonate 2-dehydrogenase